MTMLQLKQFYEQCYLDFSRTNPRLLTSNQDIQAFSRDLFLEIDQKRKLKARRNFRYFMDQIIWTNKGEHIDDPEFDVEIKKQIILGLHLKNTIFKTYTKSIEILRPLIEEINRNENRPARVLEIGSGIGKLTMAMHEEFQKSSLPVEMTGSDIVPEYIETAKREAKEKNYNIDFKVIDAYKLDFLEANSYDIVFTLHSMHHFSPDQLAVIMAGSQNIATSAFVGIDGYRGLGNLLFMMISGFAKGLLSFSLSFFHDSFISGRRMYSAKQLEILAKLSCPKAKIIAENLRPGLTVVKILSKTT